MIAETTIVYDGHTYHAGDTIPSLGTVECIKVEGNKRFYNFLSTDLDKLPTYDDLGAGSYALATDTSELYIYEKSTKTWYQQGADAV